MKKIISVACAVCLSATLATACGQTDDNDTTRAHYAPGGDTMQVRSRNTGTGTAGGMTGHTEESTVGTGITGVNGGNGMSRGNASGGEFGRSSVGGDR